MYDKEKPLRVFTAFSGYDSQCLALERLKNEIDGFDYTLVGWSEINPFAIKAHDAIFPEASGLNYGDISKIDWAQAPDFDLFTMSSPCQDFSVAGKQAGGEEGSGTRSSLLWECKKAIAAKKPKYVLFENVPALVSQKFRKGFFKWIKWLDEWGGYTSFYQVLDAAEYGVPQHRERVFMVSILRAAQEQAPSFYFPKPFPLERRLKDVLLPYGTVPESYYLSQEKVAKILAHCDRKVAEGCGFRPNFQTEDGLAGTIMTKYGGRETDTYIKEGLFADAEPEDDAESENYAGAGFTQAVSE